MKSLWQSADMEFNTETTIHFDEADPAGIAFAGGIFTKMHRCYEAFIKHLGQDPKKFFLSPELIFPLRHVEVDYFRPLLPLETYQVRISVLKLSSTSFQLQFSVEKDEQLYCQLQSTHVCVDPKKMQKSEIPNPLKANLQKFVTQQ